MGRASAFARAEASWTGRGERSGPVREGKASGQAAGPRGVGRNSWAALDQFGLMGLGLGFLSHFYFLSSILFPISNQTNTKLNSNKFESKNLVTQTNKEMLQHDATTKLNL